MRQIFLEITGNIGSIVLYFCAAFSLGSIILRWTAKRTHVETQWSFSRLIIACVFGVGALASLWACFAIFGALRWWTIYPTFAAIIYLARREFGDAARGSCKSFRRIWAEFKAEPVHWQILGLVMLMKLLILPFYSVTAAVSEDATHYNLSIAKMTAHLGRLVPIPNLEDVTNFGSIGEMTYAALMIIKDMVPIDLMTGCLMICATILLVHLGRNLGLRLRGSILVVMMVVYTLPVYIMLGSGGVHPFGVSLALASVAVLIVSQDRIAAGLLAGLANVAVLSNVIAFWPLLVMIICWQEWPKLRDSTSKQKLRFLFPLVFVFGLWSSVPFLSHFAKNWTVTGNPFSMIVNSQYTTWGRYGFAVNSRDAIVHYLSTYPFATVFGNYATQNGNLFYLTLLFLPFGLLIRVNGTELQDRKFNAATLAWIATAALFIWHVFFPGLIITRYILATLFMFVPLAGLGGELLSKILERYRLGFVFVLAIFFLLSQVKGLPLIPDHLRLVRSLETLSQPMKICDKDHSGETNCKELQVLNDLLQPGDRVIFRGYYVLGLKPENLLCASSLTEINTIFSSGPGDPFWSRLRKAGFKYIYLESPNVNHFEVLLGFDNPPADLKIVQLYNTAKASIYRVDYPELSSCNRCTEVSPNYWKINEDKICQATADNSGGSN